jgi:hypothetical protein
VARALFGSVDVRCVARAHARDRGSTIRERTIDRQNKLAQSFLASSARDVLAERTVPKTILNTPLGTAAVVGLVPCGDV